MVRFTCVVAAMSLLVLSSICAAQDKPRARIGYLSSLSPSESEEALQAFRAKLRELGYVEGQNLHIDYRYADGKFDRLQGLAADLVRLKVDLILTYTTPGARAAKAATSTIPIVFAVVSDPLAAGLVTTLTRPGGNVTGVTPNNPDLSGKRVSLLKEAVPAAVRVGVLANPSFSATPHMLAETQLGARALGVELQTHEVSEPTKLAAAFGAMKHAKVGGVIVLTDPMFIGQRRVIADLALSNRLPAIYHLRQFVEVGGLMSYGAEYADIFEQSAMLVGKILRGAKPADLPVEQPWRYSMAINMKTAAALGLTIPASLRLRADRIVE